MKTRVLCYLYIKIPIQGMSKSSKEFESHLKIIKCVTDAIIASINVIWSLWDNKESLKLVIYPLCVWIGARMPTSYHLASHETCTRLVC